MAHTPPSPCATKIAPREDWPIAKRISVSALPARYLERFMLSPFKYDLIDARTLPISGTQENPGLAVKFTCRNRKPNPADRRARMASFGVKPARNWMRRVGIGHTRSSLEVEHEGDFACATPSSATTPKRSSVPGPRNRTMRSWPDTGP